MPQDAPYPTKDTARQAAWHSLQAEGAAPFPYPPHGRIPNFAGAERAAVRLLGHGAFQNVATIKANPDAPQHPPPVGALQKGITLYMPAPRLREGFYRLDPGRIPTASLKEAASLSGSVRWAEAVPLDALGTAIDLVVTGSVAVTRSGKRCGKGHGFAALEYALLRELGHPLSPWRPPSTHCKWSLTFPTEPSICRSPSSPPPMRPWR